MRFPTLGGASCNIFLKGNAGICAQSHAFGAPVSQAFAHDPIEQPSWALNTKKKRTSIRFRRKRSGCDLGSGWLARPFRAAIRRVGGSMKLARGVSPPYPPRLRLGRPSGRRTARADLSHPPPIDPHKFDIGDHASKRRRLPISQAALPSRQFQARRDQAARDPQTKHRGEPGRQTCGPVTEMSHLTYKIPTISSEEANRD